LAAVKLTTVQLIELPLQCELFKIRPNLLFKGWARYNEFYHSTC
jgi:hypothetical protein